MSVLHVVDADHATAVDLAAGEAALAEVDTGLHRTLRGAPPRGWTVEVAGRRVRGGGRARLVRAGLATVGTAPVAADVTVHDHLAAVAGATRAAELLVEAPLLRGRGADPAGVLSGGERRVLAWLRAHALDPLAVLLDHAGEGLDADTRAGADQRVAHWRRGGVAVVVRAGRTEERGWVEGS